MEKIIHDLQYMPKGHTGHLCGTKEVVDAWLDFYSDFKFTNLLQFGFNTGWSAALLLTMFPEVKVTSIELVKIDNSSRAVDILEERFPGRHTILWGNSIDIAGEVMSNNLKMPLPIYDAAFIDGGHPEEVTDNDIKLCRYLGIKNFIFDDVHNDEIKKAIENNNLKLSAKKFYKETKYKIKGYVFKNNMIELSAYHVK